MSTFVPARPRPAARRRLSALVAAAVLGGVGAGFVTPPATQAAEPAPGCVAEAVGCFPRMAMGLAAPGLPRDTAPLGALSAALGRQPDVVGTFTAFRYSFDAANLRALALAGSLPMVTWSPFDPTNPSANPYPLRDIAAGASDVYLRAQAANLQSVGRPVALRFAHEMNADWYPWGVGVNGNTPADYVAAYRHIHDVFAAEGVHNVTWVWSPASLDTISAPDLGPLYPGDDYVDWAGLSVYFDNATDTWANTVVPTLRQLDRVAPSRPVYLAETGVLPGPTRAAMIHNLLGNLLTTPRAIGFTWFDVPSREDWRIDGDPAALAAVRDELASGWYAATAASAGPVPLVQVAPSVSGTPRVDATLTGMPGAWRGATSLTGRWLACADATLGSCSASAVTGPTYAPVAGDLGKVVRYEVVARNATGASTVTSAASAPVLMTPARPARPLVEGRSGGAHVVFPAPPLGTTHWRLRVDGAAMQLVPVSTADYWLVNLVNGSSHTLSLAAVALSSAATLESPPTSGTFVPMTQQGSPYAGVSGSTATFTLPKAPVGAEGWVLTVNGVEQWIPLSTVSTAVPGLPTGQPLRWSLVAGAGLWNGQPYGSSSLPSAGAFTPLGAPAVPVVTPGAGSLTLTLPTTVPPGATGWRVSVGPTTYPDLQVGTVSFTATGLYRGYPSTWTLRAVTATSSSLPVTGKAAAL